jgi:hypothetical protein
MRVNDCQAELISARASKVVHLTPGFRMPQEGALWSGQSGESGAIRSARIRSMPRRLRLNM